MVHFSGAEWASLDDGQRELYRTVMEDNYEMLVSLCRLHLCWLGSHCHCLQGPHLGLLSYLFVFHWDLQPLKRSSQFPVPSGSTQEGDSKCSVSSPRREQVH